MKAKVKAEIHMVLDPLEVLVIHKALSGKTMDAEEIKVREEILEQMDNTVCFGVAEGILD